MLTKEMENFLAENEAEALALLRELAQIPAPSGKEERRARFCRDWLISQSAEGVYIDEALNVLYPVGAQDRIEVFAAHTDVVFPDETTLPLSERNGRLYCPGIGDDTACLVCLLLAAKFIAGCEKEGRRSDWQRLRGIDAPGLLLVCDTGEEGLGNLRGMREVCRVYGPKMESFCTFDSTLSHLTNRAVGSRRYRVSVDTKGGHSFHDFGADNAIEKLSGIVERLYRIRLPKDGRTTYNVGCFSSGTTVNSIAQHAELLYEIRSEEPAYLTHVEQRFQEILKEAQQRSAPDTFIRSELLGERPCGRPFDLRRQEKLTSRAVAAVKAATGKQPACGSGSTDCNLPLSLGIPSVCVGCYEGSGAHTREEYVEISSLKKGYRTAFEMIFGPRR